jgi:hypothetical protein
MVFRQGWSDTVFNEVAGLFGAFFWLLQNRRALVLRLCD